MDATDLAFLLAIQSLVLLVVLVGLIVVWRRCLNVLREIAERPEAFLTESPPRDEAAPKAEKGAKPWYYPWLWSREEGDDR